MSGDRIPGLSTTTKEVFSIIALVVLLLVLVNGYSFFIYYGAYDRAIKDMQEEAVTAGHARRVPVGDGSPEFEWLPPCGAKE